MSKNKVLSEKETRNKIINYAKAVGCEPELSAIFNRVDLMLKNCNNAQERAEIAKYGAIEIYHILDSYGELEVSGKIVVNKS